ncbi:MAG: cobalamin B12-binding domain-containing protein [Deltaproteobacteria bacterium]|nr:cobalamin B12-binding domain-containing protein [Deltaproteobacteria bacterium]
MDAPNFQAMKDSVVQGDVAAAKALAERSVQQGHDLLSVVEQGFAEGIRAVGELWEQGEYFLPELVQGAEAMKGAMAVLQPAMASRASSARREARVVIGTVRGDMHDIGKSLVATMLAANGFEVHDLGCDVAVESFVDRAKQVGADIVAASALLTTTMGVQRDLVRALASAGLSPHVLVGGAPASDAWAREIGAHFADNAIRAVQVAQSLVQGKVLP